MLYFLEFISLL